MHLLQYRPKFTISRPNRPIAQSTVMIWQSHLVKDLPFLSGKSNASGRHGIPQSQLPQVRVGLHKLHWNLRINTISSNVICSKRKLWLTMLNFFLWSCRWWIHVLNCSNITGFEIRVIQFSSTRLSSFWLKRRKKKTTRSKILTDEPSIYFEVYVKFVNSTGIDIDYNSRFN